MAALGALALLSSPAGAKGGGAQLPSFDQQIKSAASSSLDSSGSVYNQKSGSGDFIVGGSKDTNILLLAGVAVIAFLLLKR